MTYVSSPTDLRIRKILQDIEGNPSTDVEDLAITARLSVSRLSHLFKDQMGISLNSFLANARLDKAAELLLSTEMQIKEITYTVGYNHASSFDRAFRKRFQSSPNNYRNERRLEMTESAKHG
jgi:AraC family transcriptional regulator of arabinose operon